MSILWDEPLSATTTIPITEALPTLGVKVIPGIGNGIGLNRGASPVPVPLRVSVSGNKIIMVRKRDGRLESAHPEKIFKRIIALTYQLQISEEDVKEIASKVEESLSQNITTVELDELSAEVAVTFTTRNPDFGILAARIAVNNLHKETEKDFFKVAEMLYNYVEPKTGQKVPLLSDTVFNFIKANRHTISSRVVYSRDYKFDYFGYKTLSRSYLLKINGKIVERPSHMWMRVACGIHADSGDLEAALETYDLMSQLYAIHASPTLFHSGMPKPQLSSCFLVQMKDDSIEGIYETLKQCAEISKYAGGIGLSVHNIRATGSYIKGTNGTSNGIIPMLRVFNNSTRYVDQGGQRRKGAMAIYLEPWHADIFGFIELRKNHGNEENRCRDLFLGLWTPDLFMERVLADGEWSLICPHECPGLSECWGEKFNALYQGYEKAGKARKVIKARDLWWAILDAQEETGTPYMLYKDACNRKSNQQNLGTIKSSNLCTEILEYTSPDEIAVCNLASIALPMCIIDGKFNYDKLFAIVAVLTRNLNKVIDINYYPVKEAENSNLRHRPIGIGIQGLADAFLILHYPFEGPQARELNKNIFEVMYFAALTTSKELAKEKYQELVEENRRANGDLKSIGVMVGQYAGAYSSFVGSPLYHGKIQQNLWHGDDWKSTSGLCDWDHLKAEIKQYGVRNSLLLAPMPTASTSQILGNNECFEPYTSNLYVRRTLAGEFTCISRHLIKDLIDHKIWSAELKNEIIYHKGSVQNIDSIPQDLKDLHKTVFEIKQRHIIDMRADAGQSIDQSQSMNIHMAVVNRETMTSMHFHAWMSGLKTGCYYIRTKPAADAIQVTIDPETIRKNAEKARAKINAIKEAMDAASKDSKSTTSPQQQQGEIKFVDLKPKTPSPESSPKDLLSPSLIEHVNKSKEAIPVLDETTLTKLKEEEEARRKKREEALECSIKNKDACISCQ